MKKDIQKIAESVIYTAIFHEHDHETDKFSWLKCHYCGQTDKDSDKIEHHEECVFLSAHRVLENYKIINKKKMKERRQDPERRDSLKKLIKNGISDHCSDRIIKEGMKL